MYQTIVFDLDGTLLDTIGDLAAAGNEVCRGYGWPEHSVDEFKGMVGHGMANLISKFSPPEAQSEAQRAETLRRFTAYYDAHCADRTRPYPGIPEMLGRLSRDGARMAVWSNKADAPSQYLIGRFFPGIFAWVQGKREGAPLKPDPTVLFQILDALGADRSRTLFVGDSPTDIRAGHAAGLPACGASWGYRPRASLEEAGADFLADTPEELEAVIRRGP